MQPEAAGLLPVAYFLELCACATSAKESPAARVTGLNAASFRAAASSGALSCPASRRAVREGRWTEGPKQRSKVGGFAHQGPAINHPEKAHEALTNTMHGMSGSGRLTKPSDFRMTRTCCRRPYNSKVEASRVCHRLNMMSSGCCPSLQPPHKRQRSSQRSSANLY